MADDENNLNKQQSSQDFRVNTRLQVRPRSYKRRFKKAKVESNESQDDHDDSLSDPGPSNTLQSDTVNSSESQFLESVNNEDVLYRTGKCMKDDEDYDMQDKSNSDTEDLDTESCESELIDFIKNQENTVLESLLDDLNPLEQNDYEEDENIFNDEETNEDISSEKISECSPVQPGHSLTVKASVLLIWIFAITHSLTSSQLQDLLTLINIHLIASNPAFESLHRFKTFFANLELPAKRHYFCSYCTAHVDVDQNMCSNPACSKNLGKNAKDYFLELDVESQLTNFYSQEEFLEGLSHRFTRVKKKMNNIEDVYDSSQYRKLYENGGPLSKKNNISFTFNTDGVPIFKSSKTSIWPIFLMINELPYRMRKSKKYMILAGLWCGSTKPSMNTFLEPLSNTLSKLEKGVSITTESQTTHVVRAFLFAVSCDLPARSAVLNINQHNGEGCCIKCEQNGENHRTDSGGNIRIFPYNNNHPDPTEPRRTHESVVRNAQEAMESKRTVNGIKGPSILMFCPQFDTVKGISIDYMHLICLGSVRLLTKLWFTIANSLKTFSLYKYVDVVDSRLQSIKPPHIITRKPRSISEHLKFWKAAELRSWLFYYSIPCVFDLLPPLYLYHYCAFVEALFLLSQSSISEHDIEKSEKLLQYFVFMFPSLYDARYVTINIHSLLHLPTTVKELGPLWSTSCFAFESANGDLLKLFHGTQCIDLQIVNAVHVFQKLPLLSQSISTVSVAHKLVAKLTKQRENKHTSQFSLVGKGYDKMLTNSLKVALCNFLQKNTFDLKFYNRAVIRDLLYHSIDYSRVSQRNSYTVKYFENKKACFGYIMWFADQDEECSDTSNKLVCIQKLEPVCFDLFNMHHENVIPDRHINENFMDVQIPHMHFVQTVDKECIVHLSDILDLCVCIEIEHLLIVFDDPNHHERNL